MRGKNMQTIKQHLDINDKNNQYRLIYDRWKCPNSKNKEQVKTELLDYETLIKEYGDFIYTGGYTTSNLSNGGFSIDLWAIATDDRKYEYPMIVNPKKEFEEMYKKALEDCEDIELYEEQGNEVGYWDIENEYERIYFHSDTIETLKQRILIDPPLDTFLDKEKLAEFLLKYMDSNSIICMNKLALVYETEDNPSKVREVLEEETGDEYAWYIAELGDNQLGCTWVEKQIPVINVSNLVESANNIALHPDEYLTVEDIFTEGLLQTIFHECRHLFYECNELISIGNDTKYPSNGGLEDEVEDYGNLMASKYIKMFAADIVNIPEFEKIMPKMISECCKYSEIEMDF